MSFIVGIDLGTTNCAVAYVERGIAQTEKSSKGDASISVANFPVPQLVAPGEVAELGTLPSFLLLPESSDVGQAGLALPWKKDNDFAVGRFAQARGAEIPLRVVSSAKSWLSHAGVDHHDAILPWRDDDGAGESDKNARKQVSPVEASHRFLAHIRDAWNIAMPEPLEAQDIFLTVPASFDAQARELTAEAAALAGFSNLILLEEPQAAFYSWLANTGDSWRQELNPGDVVLVCDIGGGTSDFSLIEARDDGTGNLSLERIAVGQHILLGGDNIDLALAYCVEAKLAANGKKLGASQKRALVFSARRAKEELLSNPDTPSIPITVLGGGSKLIGGTLRSEITQSDITSIALDGFFPITKSGEGPARAKHSGLRQIGLPYASDPAISKHLAAFLSQHETAPNVVLFNGGVTKGDVLRDRLTGLLGNWFEKDVRVLSGTNADLAVARGAAYYGLVREGRGIRIRGGTARAYYVGIESAAPAVPGFTPPMKALCVASFGMEEGETKQIPGPELGLWVGEPTSFRFFSSSVRKDDVVGAVIEVDESTIFELAPIETNLRADDSNAAGQMVPVTLSATVTEVGTLEIWGTSKKDSQKWRLEYSVRND